MTTETKKDLMFSAITNGIVAEDKHIKQVYVCYIDGEYCVVDMQTDVYYLLEDYGKTWALLKEELSQEKSTE